MSDLIPMQMGEPDQGERVPELRGDAQLHPAGDCGARGIPFRMHSGYWTAHPIRPMHLYGEQDQ